MGKKYRPPIPIFKTPIIETHCHLDYLEHGDVSSHLEMARDVGVKKFVTISVSKENLNLAIKLASSHVDVWATQGIHPHSADEYNLALEDQIRINLESNRVVAIGEIGLDYYYNHCDKKTQKATFEKQLQLAADVDLPVVIHTRDADHDMKEILSKYSKLLHKKGVIHSFTSSIELAEFCLSEKFKLGFNGIATFNSAQNVRDVVAITPLSQIVLETDSPYLTPVPYRGRPNSPCYLPFIACAIAKIKEIDTEDLLEKTYSNSIDLFNQLKSSA